MKSSHTASGLAERQLFIQALEKPAGKERAAFLHRACVSNPDQRARLEALLHQFEALGSFLEKPAVSVPDAPQKPLATQLLKDTVVATSPAEQTGDQIGRYKLLEKLGEGGFGAVYVAEQREPVKRRVALKLIKLGMDTRQVVARFEAERQALALMDHPNIAKVLDAGSTDNGRPYFVMELVKGVPITRYCDQENVSARGRLELFVQVCHAIQHAHQKGIIHRDIKPSNILVTLHDGVAVPKVIDFGIAKATQQELTEKTVYTQFQQFIGTPAYMSPEQAEMSGLDIDTRSDTYSLGVLLYELLTDSTPFDTKELLRVGLDEMRRIIREREPMRPSTRLTQKLAVAAKESDNGGVITRHRHGQIQQLIGLLRGDLDWIVMKCLEKDRSRRYETANGLALDLKRHLSNEPVTARPPSATYRVQKFARRNKVIVGAAAAIATAMVFGTLVSVWQAVRAQQSQAQALKERQLALEARAQAEAQELAARQRAYSSDMTLAGQELEAHNLGLARDLLNRQQPNPGQKDLRGWEWRFLWARSRGDDLFALRGHTNSVPSALFLGDRQTSISVGQDQTLRFWNLETRSLIAMLKFGDEAVRAAVSPDGHWLAIGGNHGLWSFWDAPARRQLFARTNADRVAGLAFSPNSLLLAIADTNSVEIWNTTNQSFARAFPRGQDSDASLVGLAFSPDSEKLAYAHADFRIVLRDLKSGAERPIGQSSYGIALSLAFSPDGRTVVSADRRNITVWDITGRSTPRDLTNHLEQVGCVTFSPDGALLASASSDQTLKLWETRDWQETATLKGHEADVNSVDFSIDGRSLISSSKDGTVRVWNVERPRAAPDLWVTPGGSGYRVSRSNRDRVLRFLDGGESATVQDLINFKESSPQVVPAAFRSARYSTQDRSARMAAVALKEGPVELWRTDPFIKLSTVAASSIPARGLALGETGRWLAVQRANETTELWDLSENRLVKSFPAMQTAVRFSESLDGLSFWTGDRRLVRISDDTRDSGGVIEIIAIPEGAPSLIHPRHNRPMTSFALTEDGALLATAGWDARVRLYEVKTDHELVAFRGQLVGYTAVAFSPDGSRLAGGGYDGRITLWDVASRQQVCSWKAHRRFCTWLCFVQGGRTLASAGQFTQIDADFQVRLWHAPSWGEIEAVERKTETETETQ